MIAERIVNIKHQLQQCAAKAGLPGVPELIVVTKGRSVAEIVEAYQAGCRHFGENKWQEAAAKFIELKARYPDIVLHFIGHLQTNKVADVVEHCAVIHTVDRLSLVLKLAHCLTDRRSKPKLLLQVNVGREKQKGGVMPEDLAELLQHCQANDLQISGLMCLPPRHVVSAVASDVDAGQTAAPAYYFNQLHTYADQWGLHDLSMGMSADYEQAVACGSTYVRIGRGIFA